MENERRSTWARLGIAALNLLTPGLGLLRLGMLRAALVWLVVEAALFAGLLLLCLSVSEPSFIGVVIVMAVVVAIGLAILIGPVAQSWRASAWKCAPGPWWTRWYALVGCWLLQTLAAQGAVELLHSFYKPFYAAAESMAPTLVTNDRLLADMRRDQMIDRGMVLLFDHQDQTRIVRVVGLPGDRVAMRGGVPVINGVPVYQHFIGKIRYVDASGPIDARRLEEKLPGEKGTHFILDHGYEPMVDEMSEIRVPAGRYFVMGDNRDRAADSRVPLDMNGVGLLPRAAVRGRPLFIHWSADLSKIGEPINP